MNDRGIVVAGIPVPLSSPVFLSIVAIHVATGLVCVVAGVAAMLSAKRAGRHPFAGSVYYWSLLVVFLSMTALSVIRWPRDNHLLVLGVLSFGAAVVGRAARRRWRPPLIVGSPGKPPARVKVKASLGLRGNESVFLLNRAS